MFRNPTSFILSKAPLSALCDPCREYYCGQMGVYMGIFNFFITFPQIVNGIFGWPIVHSIYNDKAIYAIVMSGIFMFCAAVLVVYVQDDGDIKVVEKK